MLISVHLTAVAVSAPICLVLGCSSRVARRCRWDCCGHHCSLMGGCDIHAAFLHETFKQLAAARSEGVIAPKSSPPPQVCLGEGSMPAPSGMAVHGSRSELSSAPLPHTFPRPSLKRSHSSISTQPSRERVPAGTHPGRPSGRGPFVSSIPKIEAQDSGWAGDDLRAAIAASLQDPYLPLEALSRQTNKRRRTRSPCWEMSHRGCDACVFSATDEEEERLFQQVISEAKALAAHVPSWSPENRSLSFDDSFPYGCSKPLPDLVEPDFLDARKPSSPTSPRRTVHASSSGSVTAFSNITLSQTHPSIASTLGSCRPFPSVGISPPRTRRP